MTGCATCGGAGYVVLHYLARQRGARLHRPKPIRFDCPERCAANERWRRTRAEENYERSKR